MTPTKSNEKHHDDLSAIKGIGKTTERWLNRTLGVRTYEDLANRSSNEIEAGLRARGRTISRKQIEEWLTQAGKLAGATPPEPKSDQGPDREHEIENQEPVSTREGWKPFATFVVEFQARAGADSADRIRTVCQQHETANEGAWPGIDCEQTCQWILNQIEEELDRIGVEQPSIPAPTTGPPGAVAQEPSAEARPAESPAVTVEITQVRAFQPPQSETPRAVAVAGGGFSGVVTGDEPVSFEVSFQLAGSGAIDMARSRSRFTTELYAYSRRSSASQHMTAAGPGSLEQDKLSYTMVLPESLLSAGMYRMECVAALAGTPHAAEGHLKIPFLRVA